MKYYKIKIDAWGCFWVILGFLFVLYLIGGIKIVITKGNSDAEPSGLKKHGVQTNVVSKPPNNIL